MYVVGCTHSEACIPCGRLYVHLFERRSLKNFAVGHAIECYTAGEAYRPVAGSRMQASQHFEENFFEADLQRSGKIAMPLFERLRWVARWAQALAHIIAEHSPKLRGLSRIVPGHFRPAAMMREKL